MKLSPTQRFLLAHLVQYGRLRWPDGMPCNKGGRTIDCRTWRVLQRLELVTWVWDPEDRTYWMDATQAALEALK